jgi:hypothetical protein
MYCAGDAEEARRLSFEIEQTSQPSLHSSAAADELEAEFDARVAHIATFDNACLRRNGPLQLLL